MAATCLTPTRVLVASMIKGMPEAIIAATAPFVADGSISLKLCKEEDLDEETLQVIFS